MSTAIIKPQWSPLTIALMVVGFILWWPLGLAMLGYILWGEKFGGSAEKADAFFKSQKAKYGKYGKSGFGTGFAQTSSGNAAFDDYREQQLKRLEEERRRLDEEIAAFHEHMENLRRARDREEFDRFMRERNHRPGDTDETPRSY
ncbi:DUF2852 domain-containing protein [Arsenicitalea aurantiaca]|uniref:DUF2852 domain-containing protein n=1 Tax=Arsenicitalea aurantiaca TaxID=1783274 RepID=A0A433X834_9HYPH|nr:DUF2852 domain-containing protein [Arsenicitalea aurantiaca]RUT30222.1 DUF2852 domain-containing protein [Arsenicitalea aurantiaca]